MGEVRDTFFYLSKLRQSALGTHFSTAADFMRILPNNPLGNFPDNQKFDDVGRGGREFAGTVCAGTHWELIPLQLPIPLDFDVCGRLAFRGFGGTMSNSTPETGVRLYTAGMLPKATSRQLPASDIILVNEGYSFLLGDMIVAALTLSQNGLDRPLASFDLLNTGYFVNPHGVASLVDTITDQPCLTGAGTTLTLTDDTGTHDLYASDDVRDHSFTLANPLIVEPKRTRKGNDPTCGPAGGTHQYITKLKHTGFRTFNGTINIVFGSTIPYWVLHAKTYVINNLIIKYKGPLAGATEFFYFQITVPKCTIRATPAADLDSDMGYTLNIAASEDSVTLGGATLQVQNNITSNFT